MLQLVHTAFHFQAPVNSPVSLYTASKLPLPFSYPKLFAIPQMSHVVSGLRALHMVFVVSVVPFLHDFPGTFHSLELDSPTTPSLEFSCPPQKTAAIFSVS